MRIYNTIIGALILSFGIFLIVSFQQTNIYESDDTELIKKTFEHEIEIQKKEFLSTYQYYTNYRGNSEREILFLIEKLITKYQEDTEMLEFIYKQSSYLLLPNRHSSLSIHHVTVPTVFEEDREYLLQFLKDTPELFPHLSYSLRNDPDFSIEYLNNIPEGFKNADKIDSILKNMESTVLENQEVKSLLFDYTPFAYLLFSPEEKLDPKNMLLAFSREPFYFNAIEKKEQYNIENIKILDQALMIYNKNNQKEPEDYTELTDFDDILGKEIMRYYENLEEGEEKNQWNQIMKIDDTKDEELNDDFE
ncbi:hypothetical protein COB57_06275 [Candidatus Peregrinibacteria bacterium]|nr:MAG: hypothetical protein COB57_06275 [Candidatus Peregrinibacteria bacterium]